MAEVPYQSLYRRYRPQRFSEVRGQDHVTRALRNSVRQGTVSHAYLFSGPRGTGKTSTARILAKALNCTSPVDGEPCCECESCLAVAAGTSLDVHELDAASNNGVEAMRDLVARAALGTPGRWKVYIVDEVHMLTAAASNALLKTLEEPPGHVVFVLATTDQQKVLDTIKSRTQHFEFRLLAGELLAGLLKDVSSDAGLGLPGEAIDLAVRRGHGSARDALSFLDQVAAAGVVEDEAETLGQLIEAVAEGDVSALLTAVAAGLATGLDPQRLGSELLAQLRFAFLATMAPDLVPLPDDARRAAAEQAGRLGIPMVVKAMETVGRALVDMKEALDQRVYLEVALIGLVGAGGRAGPVPAGGGPAAAEAAAPGLDALVARLDHLEHRLAALEAGTATREGGRAAGRGSPAPSSSSPSPGSGSPGPSPGGGSPGGGSPGGGSPGGGSAGAAQSRAALGAVRAAGTRSAGRRPDEAAAAGTTEPARPAPPTPAGSPATGGPGPSRDDIVKAWGDGLLASLKGRTRALYRTGRFVEVTGDGTAVFAVPNETHRRYSEECRRDVEDALEAHFGVRVPIRLVLEPDPADGAGGAGPAGPGPDPVPDDDIDLADLESGRRAPPARPEDRLLEAFPGAEEVQP